MGPARITGLIVLIFTTHSPFQTVRLYKTPLCIVLAEKWVGAWSERDVSSVTVNCALCPDLLCIVCIVRWRFGVTWLIIPIYEHCKADGRKTLYGKLWLRLAILSWLNLSDRCYCFPCSIVFASLQVRLTGLPHIRLSYAITAVGWLPRW